MTNVVFLFSQKIEESDDEVELTEVAGFDMMASDIEQMQSLLEFKVGCTCIKPACWKFDSDNLYMELIEVCLSFTA